MNKLFCFILFVLTGIYLYSQHDTINTNPFLREGPLIDYHNQLDSIDIAEIFSDNRNPNLLTIAREKSIKELSNNKDIIELYLEDTLYYILKTEPQLYKEFKNQTGYLKYFLSTDGMEYSLKDNLPDGYYCLYSLSKKESYKNKKARFLIVAGGYKDGMKDGVFVFKNEPEYGKGANIYRTIGFKNDTVNGKVIETSNGLIQFATEYNMGKKNGFYIDNTDISNCKIILYKDDNIVSETNF